MADSIIECEPLTVEACDPKPTQKRISPRKLRISDDIREHAKNLWVRGVKIAVISVETGLPKSTIKNWAARYGWIQLTRNTTKILEARQASLVTPEGNAIRNALRREATRQIEVLESTPIKGYDDLPNTPDRQGRTTMLKTMTETVSMIDDWESSNRPGLILAGALCSESPVEIAASVETVQDPACGIGPTTDSAPIQIEDNSIPQAEQVTDSHSDASQAH
jgi:hypothetical protein